MSGESAKSFTPSLPKRAILTAMATPIYLDHAAATPMDEAVLAAMMPYFGEKFHNPSALYLSAKDVAHDITLARQSVARCLGVRPAEVVFTAGGTEANNLAIHGIMQQFPEGNVVMSAIEHESVLVPARHYAHREAPVLPNGLVDMERLGSLIDDHTVLVSVMYANNEIGTIQPLQRIANLLQNIRDERSQQGNNTPLFLHTDACQAGNYLDLHLHKKGIDMMTLNGGKLYGPKQSGVLYVRTGVPLQPQIGGGGQEYGRRSGTENVAAIVGFAAALAQAQALREEEEARLRTLRTKTIERLLDQIPHLVINGSKHRELLGVADDDKILKVVTHANSLPHAIHLTIPGQDNERLIMELDEQGIQCAAGSACSASSEEPSHVLQALGLPETDIRASIRLTMGRGTTLQMMDYVVEVLAKLVR